MGDRVKRFIEGEDRKQVTLLPECLDNFVAEDNPVRIIEAFVEELDLASLGFDGAKPSTTGRPSYHPGVLLQRFATFAEERQHLSTAQITKCARQPREKRRGDPLVDTALVSFPGRERWRFDVLDQLDDCILRSLTGGHYEDGASLYRDG